MGRSMGTWARTAVGPEDVRGAVDHGHQRGVPVEHVVGERDDHDDCRGRCAEREAREALDEGCEEGRGEVTLVNR